MHRRGVASKGRTTGRGGTVTKREMESIAGGVEVMDEGVDGQRMYRIEKSEKLSQAREG